MTAPVQEVLELQRPLADDALGRVDGFDEGEAASAGDEGSVVLGRLFAAERDALEALSLPMVCSIRARPL